MDGIGIAGWTDKADSLALEVVLRGTQNRREENLFAVQQLWDDRDSFPFHNWINGG